jgi:hypothetical protein
MVLHDFLSKCLTPLQDRPRPAWMYTGVNDIMWLDRRPRSSLDEVLLAASLKALTTDQFLVELVVPLAVCESIYVNQVARTALLVAMPMLEMSTLLWCREVTSPVVWWFLGPAVWSALRWSCSGRWPGRRPR